MPLKAHLFDPAKCEMSHVLMTQLISYAQNFEDIMLWRALGHVQHGCYVDVGAQSPDTDSVSRLFHERGWRGIHVEPTPAYADQLRQARPGDLVVQAAISATAGGLAFFELPHTGLSTSKRSIAMQHAAAGFEVRETLVPAMTLDDVLANVPGPELHWLKVDVEGGELEVLQGWKTSPTRPWVVVVESTLPLTNVDSHVSWEPLLEAKGYRFAYFDGLNRFYVSTAHEELRSAFTCGPNVFDGFSLAPSSVFCAQVNIGYWALEQLREDERRAADAIQVELRRCIDFEHAEVARLAAEKLAQQAALEAKLEAERRRVETLVAQQAGYEARIEALDDLSRKHAFQEGELAAELRLRDEALAELSSQARLVQEQSAVLRDAHLAQIDRFQAHVSWLDGVVESFRADKRSAQAQTDEARRDAHRWWVEAEQLRRELVRMEDSHSWRMTAPLRGARRLAGNVVRFPGRTAKVLARPAVLWTMRRAMDVPLLRVSALRLLETSPALKARFRNLALNSGLIVEPVASIDTLQLPRTHFVRKAAHAARSARAAKVLADLRRAIEEKHG